MEYFETNPTELLKRKKLPNPDIRIDNDGNGDDGWGLQHFLNVIQIWNEPNCSPDDTIKQLSDLSIRHVLHKLGINDYIELNFMMRKYKIKFVLEGEG